MQLYVGTGERFIRDAVQNQISDRLKEAFFQYYGHRPSPSETYSWTNSLRAMSQVVQYGGLQANGILLEYQLPLSSRRIDCIVTGAKASRQEAVLVELKQWEVCRPAQGEHVVTWLGGGEQDVLHPSVQVDQYRQYLQDVHTAFHETPPVGLRACAYLHNYGLVEDDPLEDERFAEVRRRSPLFSKDDVDPLVEFLHKGLGEGDPDSAVLQRVARSTFNPSRKLMKHVADVIEGNAHYVLLDEQLVVRDKILGLLETSERSRTKEVLVVHGGPGTGKSVIALHVMAELLHRGKSAFYATGSQSFNATLAEVVGKRSTPLFRSFYSFASAAPNAIDVLIADEAHRIRKDNNLPWTPKDQRSDTPQVDLMLNASRVAVFFIDEHQSVTPKDAGSVLAIREAAARFDARVREHKLDVQFRCGGADAFIQWVDNTLDIKRSATVLWEPKEEFEFRLFDDIRGLDDAIRARQQAGFDARLVAGFCWPWSNPDASGRLVEDVQVDDFRRPWNAKSGAKRLAPDVPPEKLWAYDSRGANQVGCVYTAQGFEFDYVGVIMGPDLRYDPVAARWAGDPSASHDHTVKRSGTQFLDLVKKTYRVLLTRGLKGCYVYSTDAATRNFLRSRLRQP